MTWWCIQKIQRNPSQNKTKKQKLLELINEFSKVIGYNKIKILKSIVFLYTSTEQSENKINKMKNR